MTSPCVNTTCGMTMQCRPTDTDAVNVTWASTTEPAPTTAEPGTDAEGWTTVAHRSSSRPRRATTLARDVELPGRAMQATAIASADDADATTSIPPITGSPTTV